MASAQEGKESSPRYDSNYENLTHNDSKKLFPSLHSFFQACGTLFELLFKLTELLPSSQRFFFELSLKTVELFSSFSSLQSYSSFLSSFFRACGAFCLAFSELAELFDQLFRACGAFCRAFLELAEFFNLFVELFDNRLNSNVRTDELNH